MTSCVVIDIFKSTQGDMFNLVECYKIVKKLYAMTLGRNY